MPLPEEDSGVKATPTRPKEGFFYGGQAVIEGVMMRGRQHYAVAVRMPKTHEIVVDRGQLTQPIYVHPFWKLPFVRGLALIGEQVHLGMKSLIWSVNMNASGQDIEIGKREIGMSVAAAAVFGLLLFSMSPFTSGESGLASGACAWANLPNTTETVRSHPSVLIMFVS